MNIAEDQNAVKYVNSSIIKRLISGEPFSIEKKKTSNYSVKPISSKKEEVINTFWKPYATLLFSTNEVIDFKEIGISITDRFVVIPFNATFTDEEGNRDINIVEKLCQDLPLQIIATRAIFEFCKVLKNGKFTIPQSVQAETEKYFIESNNAKKFCNLLPINTFVGKKQYYKEYCKWCNENHEKILSQPQFGQQVLALGYRDERYSFKGKRNTYYANPTFDNDRKRNVYTSFTCDKAEKKIKDDMAFEKYLCMRLYIDKIMQDNQMEDGEVTIDLDQIIQDEEFTFDE